MPVNAAVLEPGLLGAGYIHTVAAPADPGGFHELMRMSPPDQWTYTAAEPWLIDVWRMGRDTVYEYVMLTLTQDARGGREPVGPEHLFFTDVAVQRDLAAVTSLLAGFAANDQLLRCPKCRERWLICKETRDGRHFLSCSGMRRVIRSREGARSKTVVCDGAANSPPAHVEHW